MTELSRVRPGCEIRDCGRPADYFWDWGVSPGPGWLPICATHMDGLAEVLSDRTTVSPLPEGAYPDYLASTHRP